MLQTAHCLASLVGGCVVDAIEYLGHYFATGGFAGLQQIDLLRVKQALPAIAAFALEHEEHDLKVLWVLASEIEEGLHQPASGLRWRFEGGGFLEAV